MNNTTEIREVKKLIKATLVSPQNFHRLLIKCKLKKRIEKIRPANYLEAHRITQLTNLINSL